MVTDRLYYQDAYRTRFDARVLDAQKRDDGHWIRLSSTAFYPTGGGQPHDQGTLQAGDVEARVEDVLLEGEDIWHRVNLALPVGTAVQGQVDWTRRFDHMQQHSGEHMLAGGIKQLFDGFTHGLHIGREHSTIDVTLPDGRTRLSAGEVTALEELVNRRVQQNAPIRAWFPTPEELARVPLRKDPTVQDQVRVIAVGDFEYCACGGTHLSATGQIGLIKVLDTQPVRGKLRVSFLCGMRAVHHYRAVYDAATAAGQLLSAPPASLSKEVQRQQGELQALREQLRLLRQEAARTAAYRISQSAQPLKEGGRLALGHCPTLDADSLKEVASALIEQAGTVALLSAPRGEGVALLFARSADAPGDMAQLMRRAGARGGGKPDWAQGSAPDESILKQAATYFEGAQA